METGSFRSISGHSGPLHVASAHVSPPNQGLKPIRIRRNGAIAGLLTEWKSLQGYVAIHISTMDVYIYIYMCVCVCVCVCASCMKGIRRHEATDWITTPCFGDERCWGWLCNGILLQRFDVEITWVAPFPVTVTTRIITFLVRDPKLNLHLPQLPGGGTTQDITWCPIFDVFASHCFLNQSCGSDMGPRASHWRMNWKHFSAFFKWSWCSGV